MTDPDDPAGALISNKPKYVVTSSPVGGVWADATTVLGKDFLEEIARFKGVSPTKVLQVHGAVTTNGVFDVEMTPADFEGHKTVSIEDGKEVLIEVEPKDLGARYLNCGCPKHT